MGKLSQILTVQGVTVRLLSEQHKKYICISDIAKQFSPKPETIYRVWMRSRATIEFLGTWEEVFNENFNLLEYDRIVADTQKEVFDITFSEWIERTRAIGIQEIFGKKGGIFAHTDIAYDFCTFLSPRFKIYLLKEFQRRRAEENDPENKQWDLRRELTKASHEIHTDAIREHLSPIIDWHTKREVPIFASEMDLLNQAVFGMTAREFKLFKPEYKGNLRDYATTEQLEVMNGLQHLNAGLIEQGLTQGERFQILYRRARRSVDILETNKTFQQLKGRFGKDEQKKITQVIKEDKGFRK